MPGPNLLKRGRPCIPCHQRQKEKAAGVEIVKAKDKVVEATWKGAKIMPDKSVLYAKSGFEPPPELDGYERDPDNAWRFIPKWPECKKRIQTPLVKQCGAVTILSVCAHSKCPLKQLQVSVSDCQDCPFRIE
jgi:hypothetical protein